MTDYDKRTSIPPGSQPVVRTHVGGVPVYYFGYTGIYAESPTLVDDGIVQMNNTNVPIRVHPKKSWEIKSNRLGVTPPRMPRTPQQDYQPLECINLIDGNDDTCWSSNKRLRSNDGSEWFRIDLCKEWVVGEIVLKTRPIRFERSKPGSMSLAWGAEEVGRAMPKHLTIKVATDAYQWETVFDGDTGDATDREVYSFSFPPRRVKQVWVIGTDLRLCETWAYAFSIASAEVIDVKGRNVALASYGNGITCSSFFSGLGQTRESHQWYWPLHYDLGLKWSRIGYHDDPINWHWVERERGVFSLDPEAEAAIDLLVEQGVNIVYNLGFGNRLYQNDPTRYFPQLWEMYFENPEPPKTEEALEAWANFVRFSVQYFKDRIQYFEIWNEWNAPFYWGDNPDTELYIKLAKIAISVIRQCAPNAKVMLGSYAGFPRLASLSSQELEESEEKVPFLMVIRELGKDVDAIGFHPFYQPDYRSSSYREYADNIKAFKEYCASKGFTGTDYMASEYNIAANYPPIEHDHAWWGNVEYTEIQKAKLIAQVSVTHTALGVESFFCELWDDTYAMDLSLMRHTVSSYPVTSMEPQAAYYVTRNLCTALDELMPAQFEFTTSLAGENLIAWPMQREGERVLAVWCNDSLAEDCEGTLVDFAFDFPVTSATAYNPMNGEEIQLDISVAAGHTELRGILVRDYPLLIKLL